MEKDLVRSNILLQYLKSKIMAVRGRFASHPVLIDIVPLIGSFYQELHLHGKYHITVPSAEHRTLTASRTICGGSGTRLLEHSSGCSSAVTPRASAYFATL